MNAIVCWFIPRHAIRANCLFLDVRKTVNFRLQKLDPSESFCELEYNSPMHSIWSRVRLPPSETLDACAFWHITGFTREGRPFWNFIFDIILQRYKDLTDSSFCLCVCWPVHHGIFHTCCDSAHFCCCHFQPSPQYRTYTRSRSRARSNSTPRPSS